MSVLTMSLNLVNPKSMSPASGVSDFLAISILMLGYARHPSDASVRQFSDFSRLVGREVYPRKPTNLCSAANGEFVP